MPLNDANRRNRRLIWRIAGLWMVALAVGLAVVGVVLALQQTRSLTFRLMAPAEAQAVRIADTALEQFNERLSAGLRAAADRLREGSDRPWEPPGEFPTWLDGLFTWNGRNLSLIVPPPGNTTELIPLVEERLAARWQRASGDAEPGIELFYDSIGTSSVVTACVETTDPTAQPILVAAHLNLHLLRSDLVEPLLPAASGLELVRASPGTLYKPWSQRLLSAMRFWAIEPTDAFIREQYRAVLGQTLVYLGLTILALATLLIAMWVLVRVVRRDMALAEMKANFVADVSHELKTPLALIRLFGETLQSGRVTSEQKRQEYYEIITRESTRLANLINNILDFSRIEAGRKEYSLEPTDIADVVRETYEAYRTQLEHSGFEHHLTVAPTLPPVDADRDAIARVLINLTNNAIKYSRDERYLAIDVAQDVRRGRRGVLISVHDRGIGIQPEDRAHLVDGFFRAADRRVRERGGAGLGLALVKHIVDSHRGSLDVESRLVKGSTFRIFLPASERQAPPESDTDREGLATEEPARQEQSKPPERR